MKTLIPVWHIVSAQKLTYAIIVIIIRLVMSSFTAQVAEFELEV
jgi:hypothetical protein